MNIFDLNEHCLSIKMITNLIYKQKISLGNKPGKKN